MLLFSRIRSFSQVVLQDSGLQKGILKPCTRTKSQRLCLGRYLRVHSRYLVFRMLWGLGDSRFVLKESKQLRGALRLRYEERRRMSPDERSKAPVVEPRRRSRCLSRLSELAGAQSRPYSRVGDPCTLYGAL